MSFREQWLAAVDRTNSVLCVGVDPPERLPKGTNLLGWTEQYTLDLAPFASALKPNPACFQGDYGLESLRLIGQVARHYDIPNIEDRKLADITKTNAREIAAARKNGATAVTLAYATNIEKTQQVAAASNISLITMCIMSDPDFAHLKNAYVEVDKEEDIRSAHLLSYDNILRTPLYIYQALQARKHGLAGIVIGAPSEENGITEEEVSLARLYAGNEMLVLTPGAGRQRGNQHIVQKYFGRMNVMVSMSSEFNGPDRIERAKYHLHQSNGT